jgi:hypothetical protein
MSNVPLNNVGKWYFLPDACDNCTVGPFGAEVYENLELIGEPSKDHWPAHVAVKGLVGLTWNEPESLQDIAQTNLVHLCGGGLEMLC